MREREVRGTKMRKDIQPEYRIVDVTCACGAKFKIGTTKKTDAIRVDVCSECHPFYTGKQKTVQSGGRVERFMKKYGLSAEKKD